MKTTIFRGYEYSLIELALTTFKLQGIDTNKLKNANRLFPLFECYINEKGNLILSKNEIRVFLNDETYDKIKNKFNYTVTYNSPRITLDGILANEPVVHPQVVEMKYPEKLRRINFERYENSSFDNIKYIYVKNQKIIITPDRRIYFMNGNKLKRVSIAKNINKYTRVNKKGECITNPYHFILSAIANPDNFYSGSFFAFNEITRNLLISLNRSRNSTRVDAKETVFTDKETPSFFDIVPQPPRPIPIHIFEIDKIDLQNYYQVIGSYFPLIPYLREYSINVNNAFTDGSQLPTYIKKQLVLPVTNYVDLPGLSTSLDFDYDSVGLPVVGSSAAKNPGLNRRFNKNHYDNYELIHSYNLVNGLGIKDINVSKKLIEYFKNRWSSRFTYIRPYYSMLKKYYKGKVKNVELLLYNRLSSTETTYIVSDSLRMLTDAIRIRNMYKDKPFKKLDMDYLIKHSLKDIHDTLSIISRDDQLALKFTQYDMSNRSKYELDVRGYKFLMPEDSTQLTRLADVMRNCVASYSERILRKESIIVYATDNEEVIDYIKNGNGDIKDLTNRFKNNELLSPACIELGFGAANDYVYLAVDANNNVVGSSKPLTLRQCYSRHNHHVDDDNPNLDIACKSYFDLIGVKEIHNRYSF